MGESFNSGTSAGCILFGHPKAFQFRYFLLLVFFLFSLSSHAKISKDTLTGNNASILNKKISLNIQSGSLKSILEILSDSCNIGFLYIEEQVPLELTINGLKGEFTLKEFLDLILNRTNLSYFILDDQIGLTTKEFSDSIEVDSSRRAVVYSSSPGLSPDLKYYKKITVKSIKNKNVRKRVKRTYYLKKNFSIKPASGDSASRSGFGIRDTISPVEKIDKAGERKKFLHSENVSRNFLIFRITPGMTFWNMKIQDPSEVDDVNMNQYSQFHSNISAAIIWEANIYGNLMIRSGAGYFKVNKNGTQTSTKTNSFYPYISIVEKSSYSYQYSYLTIPLGLSYKFGNNKSFLVLAGEMQADLFLYSDMDFYPIYKYKYFYDINPLGTGQDPYTTSSNEPINSKRTNFRSLIFSFSLKAENNFLVTKKNLVFIAPEITFLFGSIYDKKAPVKENPFILGASLGYRHIF
jgi:hypothetical protein